MKPVLALRHVPHEGLGLLERIFYEQAVVHSVIDLPRGAPRTFQPEHLSGLVVLGGPMNVDQIDLFPSLADEVRWIQQSIAAGLPVLGICLGSQLIAKALGASVYVNSVKEIGWYTINLTPDAATDPLFADSVPEEIVFQWHGDTFDLPEGATLLASSAQCRQQAYRFGTNVYGLQFHIEVTEPMIDCWLREPVNCGELADLEYIDPQAIRDATPIKLPDMTRLGQRVLTRFAKMCRERAVD